MEKKLIQATFTTKNKVILILRKVMVGFSAPSPPPKNLYKYYFMVS